jgi:hypothetical protein
MKKINLGLRMIWLPLMVSLVIWSSSCTKDKEAAQPKTV